MNRQTLNPKNWLLSETTQTSCGKSPHLPEKTRSKAGRSVSPSVSVGRKGQIESKRQTPALCGAVGVLSAIPAVAIPDFLYTDSILSLMEAREQNRSRRKLRDALSLFMLF